MTQPKEINGAASSSGTVIFLSPRPGRNLQNASMLRPVHHAKRLRSWLVVFMILLAILVPPTLAAFTAIFALWLFALSLALGLIIFVDLARRSIRWAGLPVPI
jgi:hypothetical protein